MTAETLGVGIPLPLAWRRALLAFGTTLLVSAAATAGFVLGYQQAYADRAIPGVSVGGVAIGGLDRAAAAARLQAELPDVARGALIVRGPGGEQAIPYASLGRTYDYAGMLDTAFGIGHVGDLPVRVAEDVRALVRGASVGPLVTYDHTALQAALGAIAGSWDAATVDASVTLGANGQFVLNPAAPGAAVERAAAFAAADRALSSPATGDAVIALATRPVAPAVTTAQAAAALQAAEQMTSQALTLRVAGDPAFSATISPATLRTWVAFGPTPGGGYGPTVVTDAARAALAKLAPQIARAPRDATYLVGDGKVIGVLASQDGTQLDVDASLQAIANALATQTSDGPPPTVQLAVSSVPPALSTAAAQQTAPLMTLVGSWTTHFTPGIANYWGRNISIPAAKLDGYVVLPGAWFDFWQAVGVPTADQGYGPGGAIINGHTEETGAIAGGICSTSTTLFNAALRAGYQIGERANHYYYISRYPVGLDATVAMGTGWEQDMTWRNDTAYPVLIHAINGPGSVTFQLFSVDPHRTVTLSTPIIKNYTRATTIYQYVTALPPGQENQVEYASDGFDAWVTRTVRDATGAIIHQETFYSHYATVNGLIQIGAAKTASPSPSPSPSPGP